MDEERIRKERLRGQNGKGGRCLMNDIDLMCVLRQEWVWEGEDEKVVEWEK